MQSISSEWLQFAYWMAGANWMTWRRDYEFEPLDSGIRFSQMPVLANGERYDAFVGNYSLLHGVQGTLRDELRQRLHLNPDFDHAVDAIDGSGIDVLARELRAEFQLKCPRFGFQRSFLSKLAAFARPDVFVAWDEFARKGVARCTGRRRDASYAEYLTSVNGIWDDVKPRILNFLSDKNVPTQRHDTAFPRRVLDVCLMLYGGRWRVELS